jgi:outer membrane protein assembly factor BamB
MRFQFWIFIGALIYLSGCKEETEVPAEYADFLIFAGSYDNYFYAFAGSTGAVKWKFETGDQINSGPTISNSHVYFGSNDGYVYALAIEFLQCIVTKHLM